MLKPTLKFFTVAALLLFLGFLLVPFLSDGLNWLYNSDELYIPILWSDLFLHGNTLSGWHIAPYSNLTVTFPIYSIIRWISGEDRSALLVFHTLQNALFAVGIYSIIGRREHRYQSILLTLIVSSFFLYISINRIVSIQLVTIAYHGNTVVISLLLLGLIRRGFHKKNTILTTTLLSLGTILLIFNDNLAIVALAMPAICATIIIGLRFPDKQNWRLLGSMTVALFLGYQGSKLVFNESRESLEIKWSSIIPKLKEFCEAFVHHFSSNTWGILCLILLVLGLHRAVLIFYTRTFEIPYRSKQNPDPGVQNIEALFFATFTFALVLSNLLAVPLTGKFIDVFSFRYIGLVLIFPSVFLLQQINLYRFNSSVLIGIAAIYMVALTFVSLPYYQHSRKTSPSFLSYEPEQQILVDEIVKQMAETEGPIAGLAEFWSVGLFRFQSEKSEHQLIQISSKGHYRRWMNNIQWVSDSIPPIRFIITTGIDHKALIQRFGEPEKRLYIRNRWIWIYPEGSINPKIVQDIEQIVLEMNHEK